MRCFVIGNGPSLNETPLDRLIGEVTFACNRIHLLYDKTKWRPTYYVQAETPQFDEQVWVEATKIHLQLGCVMYLSGGHRGFYTNHHMRRYEVPKTRVEFMDFCQHLQESKVDPKNKPKSWHLPQICNYGSTVHVAMQAAVKEGFNPIYLVGCDLGYEEDKLNHFDERYTEGVPQLRDAKRLNTELLWAHKVAHKTAPVKIYNATIGGKLEVYPRVDFFKVVGE